MFPRWLYWPLFAALMGFALGGSFVAAIGQPDQQSHVDAANPAANSGSDQHQPAKTFGKRLSDIWDRTWDDPVAFYTFVLGIFTAILASISGIQIIFFIRTDKTARISALAAQRSARVLPDIERAYVFMRIEVSTYVLNEAVIADSLLRVKSLELRFNATNYGKTPAIFREIRAGIKRLKGELPVDAWKQANVLDPPASVLATGEEFKQGFWLTDPEPLTTYEANMILAGDLSVYFYGYIAYQNVFGDNCATQFCWRLNGLRFAEWGGDRHNYIA